MISTDKIRMSMTAMRKSNLLILLHWWTTADTPELCLSCINDTIGSVLDRILTTSGRNSRNCAPTPESESHTMHVFLEDVERYVSNRLMWTRGMHGI